MSTDPNLSTSGDQYVLVLKDDLIEMAQDIKASQQLDAPRSTEETMASVSCRIWPYLNRAARTEVDEWIADKKYLAPKIIIQP